MSVMIDPNAKASSKAGIFGLPFKETDAKVVFLPVCWDATTSYRPGTHKGPDAILRASDQIDFFDLEYGSAYEHGLFMQKAPSKIKTLNAATRVLAQEIIDADDDKIAKSKMLQQKLKKVNDACERLNEWVYEETKRSLDSGKMSIVVGGDHATPFGAIRAYAEKYPGLGILHFDAHSDTRDAYMGFEWSHASILRNVLEKIPDVSKVVQVGIRDFCEEEYLYIQKNPKLETYFDLELARRKQAGENFASIAAAVVAGLPKQVYITFDIDGLDPKFCPHTGTPVPGGLDYHEMLLILREVIASGRELVGFDLVEVAPGPKGDEWDANVGMRLLYKMTAAALASQGIIEIKKI
jgi:agmatinase